MQQDYTGQSVTEQRFKPAYYTDGMGGFGKSSVVFWKPEPVADGTAEANDERIKYEAAKLQHEFVYAIRVALKARKMTIRQYADYDGQSYQRTSSMLNGKVLMRLEDITKARLCLGIKDGLR